MKIYLDLLENAYNIWKLLITANLPLNWTGDVKKKKNKKNILP